MKAIRLIALLLVSLLAHSASRAADQSPPKPPFVVIVNAKNPASALSRTFLRDAFLKKTTRWPNDNVIHPVDLSPKSAVRDKFSNSAIGRSVNAVRAYWQQRIFSGVDVPPPEVESDDRVVSFVLSQEGAIGYVSGTADLRGAKQVRIDR
jgi:ABC-type phosphate transport system substrate-binding protein